MAPIKRRDNDKVQTRGLGQAINRDCAHLANTEVFRDLCSVYFYLGFSFSPILKLNASLQLIEDDRLSNCK